MSDKELADMREVILRQSIRNILIEKGIVTSEEYKDSYVRQVNKLSLTDEIKKQLIENFN